MSDIYTRDMKTVNNALFLDRNYIDSLAYQWVREAYVNSHQADATLIEFRAEYQGVNAFGVYRRMIIDNGRGIPREKMADYLNAYGGSGKTTGVSDGNFGIGIKTSLLPWNNKGLVFISKTEDGQVTLMWLRRTDRGTYANRMFNIHPNEDPATVIRADYVDLDDWDEWYDTEETDPDSKLDWTKVFPANQKSGLAIILLGDSLDQDTILGDPNKSDEQTKYGISRYINSRLYDTPVDVYVEQYGVWSDKSKWPTQPLRKTSRTANAKHEDTDQFRSAIGLRRVIGEQHAKASERDTKGNNMLDSGNFVISETNEHPGVRVHWFLLKNPSSNRGDSIHMPLTGILHASHDGVTEVYDIAAMGNKSVVSAKTRMGRFIIPEPIRERVGILFEPLPSKIHRIAPVESRTHLKFHNATNSGMEMPWDLWAEKWHEHTPKPIREAVQAYYADKAEQSSTALSDEALLRVGTSYAARTRLITAAETDFQSGTVFGRGASSGKKSAKKATDSATTPAKKDSPAKVTPIRKKSASLGVTLCKAISEPSRTEEVWYDHTVRTTYLNTATATYRKLVEDFVKHAINRGAIPADDASMRTIAENTYLDVVVESLTITGTCQVQRAAANPADSEVLLSSPVLTAPLFNVLATDKMANRILSQRIGAAKKQRIA